MALHAHAEVAQRIIQARLQIGAGLAAADDERARHLVLAGRELLGDGAGNDDRAGRHVATVFLGLVAGDVDDFGAARDGNARADYGFLADAAAFN